MIISISGKRRSGKTEAANMTVSICEEMGIKIRKISFADFLREMFSTKTGIGISMLLDPLTKEEFRGRLIAFADEERDKDENVFINNLFGTILTGENVVIDDMRLLPELVKVVKSGGKPIRIEAFKQAREERGFKYDKAIDEHISETDLDLCGHTYETLGGARIFNNKSKDHLRAELIDLVKKEFVNISLLQGVPT